MEKFGKEIFGEKIKSNGVWVGFYIIGIIRNKINLRN